MSGKNKNTNQMAGQGTNPGVSGGDKRGRTQNQSGYQQTRYENQQGPMVSAFARNYGRGSEADWGNYQDIMNRYREAAGGTSGGGGSRPFGGPGEPFESYGGFRELSQTGGVDPSSIRTRAANQVRSTYADAARGIERQRSLQGGYAPNAIAARAKMAREQGQATSDATTNAEAAIQEMAQRGRISGLEGMSQIERARIESENQARQGMASLYGTTPGMAQTFGNQLLGAVGQGGDFGMSLYGRDIEGQQLPGAWDEFKGMYGDVSNMAYPFLDYLDRQNKQGGGSGAGPNAPSPSPYPGQGWGFGGGYKTPGNYGMDFGAPQQPQKKPLFGMNFGG